MLTGPVGREMPTRDGRTWKAISVQCWGPIALSRRHGGATSLRRAQPVRSPAAHGQVGNALVSWSGWNGVPSGLTYVRDAPVAPSTTVSVVLTLVRPPAKTQWAPLSAQPSRTLTSSSTLLAAKNQNAPVSVVSGNACPCPFAPCGVSQLTRT